MRDRYAKGLNKLIKILGAGHTPGLWGPMAPNLKARQKAKRIREAQALLKNRHHQSLEG